MKGKRELLPQTASAGCKAACRGRHFDCVLGSFSESPGSACETLLVREVPEHSANKKSGGRDVSFKHVSMSLGAKAVSESKWGWGWGRVMDGGGGGVSRGRLFNLSVLDVLKTD